MKRDLINAALKARELSYSPYSHFKVGAAVLTKDGKIYSGCNIENASYGLTLCAERVAIFKAVSEGKKDIQMLAVAADTEKPTVPCGACLQTMAEFNISQLIMLNIKGDILETTLRDMLPLAFTNKDLGGIKFG